MGHGNSKRKIGREEEAAGEEEEGNGDSLNNAAVAVKVKFIYELFV